MIIKELKYKLDLLGVDPSNYSLTGKLNPDTIVLEHKLFSWIVFYFDERGGRDNEHDFNSENEACEYIYSLFKESMNIKEKFCLE